MGKVIKEVSLYLLLIIINFICILLPYRMQAQQVPIEPGETVHLFNGKDLSSFYTWIPEYQHKDPNRVFSVVRNIDGEPAIRISGENAGSLITKKKYTNYHLIAEYRWGLLTWEWFYGNKYTRSIRARDGGIQIHCKGDDGNWHEDRNAAFMYGIQYQIREGRVGDIIMMGGWNKDGTVKKGPEMSVSSEKIAEGSYRYEFYADPINISDTRNDENRIRQIHWYGYDPDWINIKGYRGGGNIENSTGEWNTIEIIAKPDTLIYKLNGTVVNVGTHPSVKAGKILIQSEYSEIYVRRLDLLPIK